MQKTFIIIILSFLGVQTGAFATIQTAIFLKKEPAELNLQKHYSHSSWSQNIHLEAIKDTNALKNNIVLGKSEKKGVFLANVSFWTFIGSAVSFALLFALPKSLIVAGPGFIFPQLTLFGNFLLLLFMAGIVVSFIIGVISLVKLRGSKNTPAKVKAWIGVALAGLLFLLLNAG